LIFAQVESSKSFKTEPTAPDSIKTAEDNLLTDLFDNDTVRVWYSIIDRPYRIYAIEDTLLNFSLRQFDPAHQSLPPYFNIGNMTSPSLNSLFTPPALGTFDIGGAPLYQSRSNLEEFIFYNPATPFVRLDYALTANARDDNRFSGDVGLNFAKQINASIHYQRFNQQGMLINDRTRTTNFSVGIQQQRWKNRWLMQIIYNYNQFYRQETNGVSNDSTLRLGGFAGISTNTPINSTTAGSKVSDWGFLMKNEISLKRDSSLSPLFIRLPTGFRIGWDISYQKFKSLYYDQYANENLADSIYYRGFNIDTRGLRNYLENQEISNSVYLAIGGHPGDTIGEANYLRAGIKLSNYHLSYAPQDSVFSLLKLTGLGHWRLKNLATITAEGYFLLNSKTPVFDLKGNLFSHFKKLIVLELNAQIRNINPGLRYEELNLNGINVFTNSLKNEFTTYISGAINFPSIQLTAGLHQHLISNLTYFDNQWRVQQSSTPASVTALTIDYKLKLRKFHLDNFILLQKSNLSEIRVPTFLSNHSLYFQNYGIHRHVMFNVGFDFHIIPGFVPYGYSPLLQQFYVPDTGILPAEFDFDLFLSFKIRLLRGFVRVDNLSNLYSKKVYYQLFQYPQDRLGIRIGFSWIFNN